MFPERPAPPERVSGAGRPGKWMGDPDSSPTLAVLWSALDSAPRPAPLILTSTSAPARFPPAPRNVPPGSEVGEVRRAPSLASGVRSRSPSPPPAPDGRAWRGRRTPVAPLPPSSARALHRKPVLLGRGAPLAPPPLPAPSGPVIPRPIPHHRHQNPQHPVPDLPDGRSPSSADAGNTHALPHPPEHAPAPPGTPPSPAAGSSLADAAPPSSSPNSPSPGPPPPMPHLPILASQERLTPFRKHRRQNLRPYPRHRVESNRGTSPSALFPAARSAPTPAPEHAAFSFAFLFGSLQPDLDCRTQRGHRQRRLQTRGVEAPQTVATHHILPWSTPSSPSSASPPGTRSAVRSS